MFTVCVSYLFLSLLIVVVPINGHVDLKASLTPPLITHTAATPMPVPKISGGEDLTLGYESRRGSNVSVEPGCHEKTPVCTMKPDENMFIRTGQTEFLHPGQ